MTQPTPLQRMTPLLLLCLLVVVLAQGWQIHLLRTENSSPVPETVPAEEVPPAVPESRWVPPRPREPAAAGPLWDADGWNPFEEMNRMREEMDAMFGRFFGGMNQRHEFDHFPRTAFPRQPSMDIRKTDEAYKITVEFPGSTASELETTVKDGVLYLRAALSSNRTREEGRLMHMERMDTRFQRRIPLPEDADTTRMESEVEDGLLRLVIPRRGFTARDTV